MPQTLDDIKAGMQIVSGKGVITTLFRLRWTRLQALLGLAPVAGNISGTGLTAALATTNVYVTKVDGIYRVNVFLRKSVADGVSSRLTATIGWTDPDGTAITEQEADLNTDTIFANQSTTKLIRCKANSAITLGVTYASNTAAKMTWEYDAVAEQMGT